MRFNAIQVISIIAIFQSIFLSVHFVTLKKGDKLLNKILALFLACFTILMMASITVTQGLEQIFIPYHKTIFLLRQLAFLIGPLLYFIVKRSININYQFQKHDLLHFIPFGISLFYYGFKLASIPQFIIWISDLRIINNILMLLQHLIYVALSIILLKRSKFKTIFTIKGSEQAKFSWLSLVIVGTILIWLIELNSLFILQIYQYFKYCHHMTSLYSASTFIFFNSITYFVLNKPEMFTKNRKYEKSYLTTDIKEKYYKKLLAHMERNKPYLNPSLKLGDIADAISIPHRLLSQIINETFHQHFYDFINDYRIKESQELLSDRNNGKMTILKTAYQVGFNSKSAFNKAFKKYSGITPSEFKRGIPNH